MMPSDSPCDDRDSLVSVIMVGFNGREFLVESIASLIAQDASPASFDILYVDNASTDGSADYVEDSFAEVRVIRLDRNLGFYGAFNLVAREMTKSRYVIALPQDALLHKRWLAELVAAAEADPRAMACTTNTVPERSPDYVHKRLAGSISTATRTTISSLGYVRVRTKDFDPKPAYTLSSASVSILIRRSLATASGMFFDDAFGHYAGDVELGLRIFAIGGGTVNVPSAIVYHLGEARRSLRDRRVLMRLAEGSRDNVLALYKTMTTPEFVLFAPLATAGLAFKAFELRATLPVRLLLFAVALALSPLVALSAVLRFRDLRDSRRELQQRRCVGRFGLMRAIFFGRSAPVALEAQRRHLEAAG